MFLGSYQTWIIAKTWCPGLQPLLQEWEECIPSCLLGKFLHEIKAPFACIFWPVSCLLQSPPVQPAHWQQPDAPLLENPGSIIQDQWGTVMTQHYCRTKCLFFQLKNHDYYHWHTSNPNSLFRSDSSMVDNTNRSLDEWKLYELRNELPLHSSKSEIIMDWQIFFFPSTICIPQNIPVQFNSKPVSSLIITFSCNLNM